MASKLDDSQLDNILSNGSEMPRMILQPVEQDGKIGLCTQGFGEKDPHERDHRASIEEILHKEMAGDQA